MMTRLRGPSGNGFLKTEDDPLLVLNDRELKILRLLACGHTAKSISERCGLSINAVNDRLRDARRKTGVGSSRELARQISFQENWTGKFGVPSSVPVDKARPSKACSVSATSFRWKALALILTAALALTTIVWRHRTAISSPASTSHVAPDQALQALGPSPHDPRAMSAALVAERRDPDWAEPTEALLFQTYSSALAKSQLVHNIHVRCGRTLCVAYAVRHRPATAADETALKRMLTGPVLQNLDRAGLVNRGLSTSSDDGSDGRLSFVTYWQGSPRP